MILRDTLIICIFIVVFVFVFVFVSVFVWRRRAFSNKIQMHPPMCTPISATGDKKPDLFVGNAPHQVHWWRCADDSDDEFKELKIIRNFKLF